jgi:AcrR family transcriptional regulator
MQSAAKRRSASDGRAQRGEATRELILDTAEQMICERGMEGVSMRQIAVAVGQGNNSVIQYYFDSKEGLVRAIIARRAGQLEAIRKTMLADATANGKTGDVKILLTILLLPIAMIKDANGRHVYAGFMQQALQAMWDKQAQIIHEAWLRKGPVSKTMGLLCKLRPDLSESQLRMRILRLNRMFASALIDWDRVREIGGEHDDEAFLLEDLHNMVASAFEAPLPDPSIS